MRSIGTCRRTHYYGTDWCLTLYIVYYLSIYLSIYNLSIFWIHAWASWATSILQKICLKSAAIAGVNVRGCLKPFGPMFACCMLEAATGAVAKTYSNACGQTISICVFQFKTLGSFSSSKQTTILVSKQLILIIFHTSAITLSRLDELVQQHCSL